MDFGLFEKIIKELSSMRRKPVTHLHGFGEPLLDALLPERIELAKVVWNKAYLYRDECFIAFSRDIEKNH